MLKPNNHCPICRGKGKTEVGTECYCPRPKCNCPRNYGPAIKLHGESAWHYDWCQQLSYDWDGREGEI